MDISKKTYNLTVLSILAALTFILGLTPIGYIPISPVLKITILCVPVLIGTLLLGLKSGLILGFIFGVTSFIQVFMGNPLGQMLLSMSPLKLVAVIFIPRLIVPITAYAVQNAISKIGNKKISEKIGYLISALTGSLTNTVLFLGMMYVLFLPQAEVIAQAFGVAKEGLLGAVSLIVLTNGVPEAIAAAIIVPTVSIAVKSVIRK